jgi:hypothetical protein
LLRLPCSCPAANLDAEYAFQRGVHTVSGTYLGARAVAGSGSMYGLAKDGIYTATIDAYAPTSQDNVAASMTKQERSRSVSVTNIAPKSAAQSGIGNGPAAIASGKLAWDWLTFGFIDAHPLNLLLSLRLHTQVLLQLMQARWLRTVACISRVD